MGCSDHPIPIVYHLTIRLCNYLLQRVHFQDDPSLESDKPESVKETEFGATKRAVLINNDE